MLAVSWRTVLPNRVSLSWGEWGLLLSFLQVDQSVPLKLSNSFMATFSFVNPLHVALENCTLTVDGPGLLRPKTIPIRLVEVVVVVVVVAISRFILFGISNISNRKESLTHFCPQQWRGSRCRDEIQPLSGSEEGGRTHPGGDFQFDPTYQSHGINQGHHCCLGREKRESVWVIWEEWWRALVLDVNRGRKNVQRGCFFNPITHPIIAFPLKPSVAFNTLLLTVLVALVSSTGSNTFEKNKKNHGLCLLEKLH